MPEPRRDDQVSALRALGLVGSLGFMVVGGAILGAGLGAFLDRLVGINGPLLVLGLLVGVVAGCYGAYRLIVRDLPWNQ